MIKTLKIQNFALVNQTEISFSQGFNVLIGETGAGKSIILKSIYYLLGAKFNKSDVRTGAEFVKVSAVFTLSKKTKAKLENLGITATDEILITRMTLLPNKNECRINGEIITLEMLAEIAGTLLDFYGQHENMVLLKVANHLGILDGFNPQILRQVKQDVAGDYATFVALKKQIDKLGGSLENRERTLDLLSYQINEIQEANLVEGEDEKIEAKLFNFRNSEKITQILDNVLSPLEGNAGALNGLKESTKALANLSKFDPKSEEFIQKLDSFYFDIEDIADQLREKKESYSFSEAELIALDERLDKIKALKRKYGNSIQQVLQTLQDLLNQREEILQAEHILQKLEKQLQEAEAKLQTDCEFLSSKRKNLAEEFSSKINNELSELGMKNAKIKVDFKKLQGYSTQGIDVVEFLFSANLGQGLKPLSKTISGGEMSRLMLAIKSICAEKDAVGTLVFDEIDAGISGEIGSAIAQKIAKISQNYQVICITHLPQVCAMADSFFYVSKEVIAGNTESRVNKIFSPIVEESIAKLSGGKFDTDVSIAHAKELLAWAGDYKKNFKN